MSMFRVNASPGLAATQRVPLIAVVATVIGLALGVAADHATDAIAAGRDDRDRPALQHRIAVAPGTPLVLSRAAMARARRDTPTTSRSGRSVEDIAALPAVPEPPAAPAPDPAPDLSLPEPASRSRSFAGLPHLQLQLPVGARAIGFHESGSSAALPMHPMGIPKTNDNAPRLSNAPVGDGFEYHVLSTRWRGNPATSAVDVAMPFNLPVQAPVTGEVVEASAYLLYGEVPDNAVYIVPDSRPDVLIVVMHLNGLQVQTGDRVEAGHTVLASTARLLPFDSQIDRYAGRMPHVHMEARQR